jgi:uncharacterized protein YndB with AHSA1/START domain
MDEFMTVRRETEDWQFFYGRLWRARLDHLARALREPEHHTSEGERPMSEYGVVTEAGTIRFERVLPGPIERVWAYLTESEKRGRWLATGNTEQHVGGKVELNFRHANLSPTKEPTPEKYKSMENGASVAGRVTRCEPPRLLAYTWGENFGEESEVTFELTPQGESVRLVLTHRRLPAAEMLSVAGGWHTHLAILEDHLAGREPRPFWSTHARLEAEYERRLAS